MILLLSEKLAKKFKFIYLLSKATQSELDEVTPNSNISYSINKFLQNKKTKEIVNRLNTLKIVRFQEKSVQNVIDGINQSKNVSFDKVLFALGIRNVGQTIAKKLANHYRDIDSLMKVDFNELILVDEVGDIIAESIVSYFNKEKNQILIERLRAKGLQFKMEGEIELISTKLKDKIFVVTGNINEYNRNQIEEKIRENGGTATSSVSKRTNFLLAGENAGKSKLEKANELNIPIITLDDFLKMIS